MNEVDFFGDSFEHILQRAGEIRSDAITLFAEELHFHLVQLQVATEVSSVRNGFTFIYTWHFVEISFSVRRFKPRILLAASIFPLPSLTRFDFMVQNVIVCQFIRFRWLSIFVQVHSDSKECVNFVCLNLMKYIHFHQRQ